MQHPRYRYITFLWLILLTTVWGQTPAPTPIESPAVVATPSLLPTPAVSATPTMQSTPSVIATPASTEAPEAATGVPPEFSSPRRSLQDFIAKMTLAGPLRPDLYLQANRHLDLSAIPTVVREEQGVTISKSLFSILDTADLRMDKLEIEPDQTSVVLYRQPSGDQIELVKQEDGRWLFSADTVEAIPRMYEVLARKGKIERWYIHSLDFDILGLNANLWLALLLLPLIAYGLGSLVVMILRIPLGPRMFKKINLADEEQKRLIKPLGWIAATLIAWLGLSLLDIPHGLLLALTVIVKILATGAVITAAFRLSDVLSLYVATFTASTSTKFDDMLIPLVRRTVKTLVAVIGVLFLAQNLNIEVWSLFAGFSIFGAMVALAGQDMVKNFFGSLTVLADQPFAVGDWITVNGIEGVVEDVGFRSTRIRTFYDSVVSLPNSQLITASVDNYGRRNYRRYSKKLAVRWNTSPEKVEAFCEGIREIVRNHPYTRKDSYQVWVNDMNDYSLQIMIYVFWATPDWNTELREKHRFLIDIHRLARKLEIEFAYPSQRVLISRHEDSFEPDFALERQESARIKGKELTKTLLAESLPKETPPPAVID